MSQIRKKDHIRICVNDEVESGLTGLENYYFKHKALPEIDFDKIDTSVIFLGKKLKAPILISSLTGGTKEAFLINKNLAKAAERCGVAMALGSGRVAISKPETAFSFRVRRYAKDIILLVNLGAVQLNYGFGLKECKKAMEMVEADGLIFHVNPIQEAIQPEGDHDFSGLLDKIGKIAKDLGKPVIVKEVGFGISGLTARQLYKRGIKIVDVAGWGGTNWALIESKRRKEKEHLGEVFSDWGISTVEAIKECRQIEGLTVIGSGGVRNGVEIAKCLALGADVVGIGLPFLKPALESSLAVEKKIEELVMELKIAMFGAGVKNIKELREVRLGKK